MTVFDLAAKLSLDSSGYEKGLNDAEQKAKGFGGRLKDGLVGASKASAKALAAVSATALAGVTALTKAAVANYSEYEQLVGGVETLFKDAADKVVDYAEDAFYTVGISANEYMETVTGFSASLLQSLGGDTEAAAKVADRAIIDIVE